jgi:hypothetical protein
MGSLIADDSFLLKDLRMFIDPMEIYDPSGKLLGLFVPANLERTKEHYARLAATIDRAELERRCMSGERGEPHHEVVKRLKTLDAEIERRRRAGERELTKEELLAMMKALREQGSTALSAAGGVANAEVPHALDRDVSQRSDE